MSDESTHEPPGSDPTEERTVSHTGPSRGVAVPGGILSAGQVLERYRVIAHLGTGGMGSVYEVEETDTGRRLALKVLEGGAARGREARERFLREGRLAASMDHAHSVFVYRADEVEGHLAIAMELMPRGTLRDLVYAEGPRPVAEAVDRALELAEALDAAHALGILHRDLKPSNVFIAPDGTAKLGDFGLSVSTGAADDELTRKDAFIGTPAYAPPEQLRGRTLDARSDLYALGAVLYFLLTGHAPFEGKGGVALVAAVLEDPPPPLGVHRSEVPEALAVVVDRLLQKDPERRFATAAEVVRALRPFGSEGIRPAGFGRRIASGAVDGFLCGTLTLPILYFMNPEGVWADELPAWQLTLASVGPILVYTTVLEGGFGTSVGRIVAGLRVVARDGARRPGFVAGFIRAVVFGLAATVLTWVTGTDETRDVVVVMGGTVVWELLLFTTRRASTGYAAVHDLLSRTRVIEVPEDRHRASATSGARRGAGEVRGDIGDVGGANAPVAGRRERIGPFHVDGPIAAADGVTVHAGTDPVLDRAAWVITRAPGAPPGRDTGTPAALRWLGGRDETDHRWDGYEAPSPGRLLPDVTDRPWRVVRRALSRLVDEADAMRAADVGATLDPGRVWISDDGTPRVLPVSWPGSAAADPIVVGDAAALGRFLHGEAIRMLGTRATAIPLRARAALDELAAGGATWDALRARAEALSAGPAEVSPRRRAGQLLSVSLTLIFFVIPIAFMSSLVHEMTSEHPEMATMGAVLGRIEDRVIDADGAGSAELADGGDDVEVAAMTDYLRRRFAPLAESDADWGDGAAAELQQKTLGTRLRNALTDDPRPGEDVPLPAALVPWIEGLEADEAEPPLPRWFMMTLVFWMALVVSGGVALLSTTILGVPLVMRFFGIAVVGPDGRPAGRGRLFLRGLLAMSPLVVSALFILVIRRLLGIEIEGFGLPTLIFGTTIVAYIAGAVWTALDPERGGVDRWVGTRLVPR